MYNFLLLIIKPCNRLKIFKRELKECILEYIQYNVFSYINRFNN